MAKMGQPRILLLTCFFLASYCVMVHSGTSRHYMQSENSTSLTLDDQESFSEGDDFESDVISMMNRMWSYVIDLFSDMMIINFDIFDPGFEEETIKKKTKLHDSLSGKELQKTDHKVIGSIEDAESKTIDDDTNHDSKSMTSLWDLLFAPLVGLMHRREDFESRITTAIDLKEQVCLINVDLVDLPSTSVMEVEVDSSGVVTIFFSNGEIINPTSIDQSNENDNDMLDSHMQKFLRGDNVADTQYTVPHVVSAVLSTSTFMLDERCDVSKLSGKATLRNEMLIMKFPLNKCKLDSSSLRDCEISEESTEKLIEEPQTNTADEKKEHFESISKTREQLEVDKPLTSSHSSRLGKKKFSVPILNYEEF